MKKDILHKAAVLALASMLTVSAGACGKTDTKEQDAYRQYGITCLENGKYEDALTAFQNALDQSLGKVGEREIDICFYKAKAQIAGGDTEGALETYNAIIDYNKDARAYYLRGNLYFDQGKSKEACDDYEQAMKKDPKNYELYIGIYQAMSAHDMEQEGQKILNKAMDIKGDKPEDNLYKGRICFLLKDMENAITYLTKAKEGEIPLASYYLALTYEEGGETQKAKACVKEYLDSGTATSYDLYELGSNEMEQQDYEEALTYFNAALAMEEVPNRQSLMKSAIAAYEYSGDFASAKKMMKDYLSKYPSDEDAKRESTFLETR